MCLRLRKLLIPFLVVFMLFALNIVAFAEPEPATNPISEPIEVVAPEPISEPESAPQPTSESEPEPEPTLEPEPELELAVESEVISEGTPAENTITEMEIQEMLILNSVNGIPDTLKITFSLNGRNIAIIKGSQMLHQEPFSASEKSQLKIHLEGEGKLIGAKFNFQPFEVAPILSPVLPPIIEPILKPINEQSKDKEIVEPKLEVPEIPINKENTESTEEPFAKKTTETEFETSDEEIAESETSEVLIDKENTVTEDDVTTKNIDAIEDTIAEGDPSDNEGIAEETTIPEDTNDTNEEVIEESSQEINLVEDAAETGTATEEIIEGDSAEIAENDVENNIEDFTENNEDPVIENNATTESIEGHTANDTEEIIIPENTEVTEESSQEVSPVEDATETGTVIEDALISENTEGIEPVTEDDTEIEELSQTEDSQPVSEE